MAFFFELTPDRSPDADAHVRWTILRIAEMTFKTTEEHERQSQFKGIGRKVDRSITDGADSSVKRQGSRQPKVARDELMIDL